MNEIYRDMIFKDLIIYIDDIIISSTSYKEYVEARRRVLQHLQNQQFWLKESNCPCFINHVEIRAHILTPEGLSAYPHKVRKIVHFHEHQDKKQL